MAGSTHVTSAQAPPKQEGWYDIGGQLARRRRHLDRTGSQQMWEVGDWLVAGEDDVFKHLNRRRVRELAAGVTGYARHTLTMAASVARKVEPSRRVGGLPWWHHPPLPSPDPARPPARPVRAARRAGS